MALSKIDRFIITKQIAKKLCYILYEAVDETSEQTVFLKVFDDRLSANQQMVYHFLNNARILSLLNHPSICKVYHYGSDDGTYFIASEAVDLAPLSTLIQETFSLSFQDLIEIFLRIGGALRQAHLQGMVHGLLNPNNIFINKDGSIKIDDFGFNWYIPNLFKNSDNESQYLAQFISPEFYEATSKIDGRVDIYSMGVILCNLLTGAPPFKGSSVYTIQRAHLSSEISSMNLVDKGVPTELEALVHKALDRNNETRFHNLKKFLDMLEVLRRSALDLPGKSESLSTPETSFEEEERKKYFDDEPDLEYLTKLKDRKPLLTQRRLAFSGFAIVLAFLILLFAQNKFSLSFFKSSDSQTVANKVEPNTLSEYAKMLPETEATKPAEPLNEDTTGAGFQSDVLVSEQTSAPVDQLSEVASSSASNDILNLQQKTAVAEPEAKVASTPGLTSNHKAIDETKQPALQPIEDKPTTEPATSKPAVEKSTIIDRPSNAKTTKATFMVQAQNQPVEAFVFIDNEFKGKTDESGLFEVAGLEINKIYTAKISKEDHETVVRKFTALEKTPTLNFDITPKQDNFGTLILEALPKADSIYVDGKLYSGKSPLQIKLPWGEHRVRFVNNSLNKSYAQAVNLKVGQVRRVKHNFATAEYGKLAISLKNAAEFGFGYLYVDGKLWEGSPNTTPLEIALPVGSHTIEVRRDGFNSIPKDIIVVVEKDQTKFVAFTFTKNQ
jgi:serine/threonine protein kinase